MLESTKITRGSHVGGGDLVVKEETLGTTPFRDGEGGGLGVLNHDGLQDGSDAMSNARVEVGIPENVDRPVGERLHDIRLRRCRQDGDLLGSELPDWGGMPKRTDVTA